MREKWRLLKPNQAPAMSLTGPAGGQVFTAPATINFAATASDADGSVARVEFLTARR